MSISADRICIRMNEVSRDPITAIELCAEWGVHVLELAGVWQRRIPFMEKRELDELEGALNVHGSHIVCISPGLFIHTEPDDEAMRSELNAKWDGCIKFCERFNVRIMIIFSFCERSGVPIEWVIEQLAHVTSRARRYGITLVLEPEPHNYANSGARLARIINEIGDEHLRVNWDPGNIQYGGLQAFPTEYEHVRGLVGYMHLKNCKCDESGGYRWATLDDGVIDYRSQLQALHDDGYSGFMTIETHTRDAGLQHGLVVATRLNLRILRRMIAQILHGA